MSKVVKLVVARCLLVNIERGPRVDRNCVCLSLWRLPKAELHALRNTYKYSFSAGRREEEGGERGSREREREGGSTKGSPELFFIHTVSPI